MIFAAGLEAAARGQVYELANLNIHIGSDEGVIAQTVGATTENLLGSRATWRQPHLVPMPDGSQNEICLNMRLYTRDGISAYGNYLLPIPTACYSAIVRSIDSSANAFSNRGIHAALIAGFIHGRLTNPGLNLNEESI